MQSSKLKTQIHAQARQEFHFEEGAKIGFFFGFSIFMILSSIGATFFASDNIIARISFLQLCPVVAANNFFFSSNAAAGKKSAESIFSFLQQKTEREQQSLQSPKIIKKEKSAIQGRIQFKKVSFRYNEHSKYILKDISFVIEAGEKVGIVGESGCGKSTLMLLMQRFYNYQGQITLDGINILHYDIDQYRQYLGVLNQESSLFSGTIEQNIVFNSIVNNQDVYQACQMSFAYDVNRSWKGQISVKDSIDEFLKRDVGSKGLKLSGGQKQRVACARAILKRPAIFLMDEGTSALDRQTEKRVQSNIDNKFKGITSVIITHRMETIQNADKYFMFQDGKIIQQGKYAQMMDRKSHFYRFVNGNRYKTIDQVAELILRKLVKKFLGGKKAQ